LRLSTNDDSDPEQDSDGEMSTEVEVTTATQSALEQAGLVSVLPESGWPPTNLGLHVWIVWLCSTSQTMPLFIT
jgi:hypothetical protein